ncbi:MAG TPA: putative glycoside hydrolase [Gemmatimonadaceae bacterium]|nr:putative glycoside hydrolase [Gemmatimonadaceae bacterium]
MHRFLFLFIATTACTAAAEHAADKQAPSAAGVPGASRAAASDSPTVAHPDTSEQPTIVRALYVNRWASQSKRRMAKLIATADSTEINGLVIDMKDEFGLNYKTANPDFAKNAGHAPVLSNVAALLDTLKAHKILAIARLVVFKDSVTAREHPEWTIRRADGSVWRDKKGIAWVNPYHRELWEYNIGVAEELVKLGFGEVQFDYIRFPEPYPSLPPQVFPGSNNMSKPDALAAYLKEAKARLNKLGVRSTADIFGLVTTVNGPLEVGQLWEKISPNADVVLPMVYPSHYPHGELGIANPNAEPYKVIETSISRARERDKKLGITDADHVRPWLQAFTLGKPEYGAEQLKAEKQAVYDSGYDSWVMWNPGSRYDVYTPGLEKTIVPRKKAN